MFVFACIWFLQIVKKECTSRVWTQDLMELLIASVGTYLSHFSNLGLCQGLFPQFFLAYILWTRIAKTMVEIPMGLSAQGHQRVVPSLHLFVYVLLQYKVTGFGKWKGEYLHNQTTKIHENIHKPHLNSHVIADLITWCRTQ